MSFDAEIKNHFKSYGFELTSAEQFVYQIKNSLYLTKRKTIEIIFASKYCPILSDNRIFFNLEFTVVPFRKPVKFEKLTCARTIMTEDELWDSIEGTTHRFEENKPFIVQETEFPYNTSIAKNRMFKSCTNASSLVVEFLDQAPAKGHVLDLGCGLGSNSILFLKKGWNVIAIDNSSLAIEIFQNKIQTKYSEFIENGQLTIVNNDITKIEITDNKFDVVVCMDVLPYIKSRKLKSLMNKISNSLVTNGQFFGSLFFNPPNGETFVTEYLSKLGAHIYAGDHIVPALLENRGFQVDECQIRIDSLKVEPTLAEFIATKI